MILVIGWKRNAANQMRIPICIHFIQKSINHNSEEKETESIYFNMKIVRQFMIARDDSLTANLCSLR